MKKEKMSAKDKVVKLCVAAMFTAMVCVATMLIQISVSGMGYLNFGDCFILIGCWILGPVYGFAAGGIGSALADIFTGYAIYAPGTLVIKGLIAVAASLIAHAFIKKNEKLWLAGHVTGAVAGETIMVVGYYLYDAVVLGYGIVPTLAGLPMNLLQGGFGAVLGVILIQVIARTGILKKLNPYAVKQW